MKIKTYKGKIIENQFYFFILNKGNNSGKPLLEPCANCFVLIADSKEEKEFYYWLCYALWQCNKFHPYLIGSVIPFIRIKDVKQLIFESEQKVILKQKKFNKSLKLLIKLNDHYYDVRKKLELLKVAKSQVLKNII